MVIDAWGNGYAQFIDLGEAGVRVEFQGNKFTVSFDGNKVIEASDDTFKNAGKVGVWTKADSVTAFDDFTYSSK